MFRKRIIPVAEYTDEMIATPVVLHVNDAEELKVSQEILSTHSHKLKGIEVASSVLIDFNLIEDVSYLSIILESVAHVPELIERYKSKKRFIELQIPAGIFSEDILKFSENIHRVVLLFQNEHQLEQKDTLFSKLLAHRLFPFVRGVPLCNIDMKHCWETYNRHNFVISAKSEKCNGCLFVKYCPFTGDGFTPSPLTNTEKYKDHLEFLQNEDTATRF